MRQLSLFPILVSNRLISLIFTFQVLLIGRAVGQPNAHPAVGRQHIISQDKAAVDYSVLNDSAVARFNRTDFKGVYALGSSHFQTIEAEAAFIGFLSPLRQQTGRITASQRATDCGERRGFEWTGEKKNLHVDWLTTSPTSFDDYFFNDLIPQPYARAEPLLTDNRLKTWLDSAVHACSSLYMLEPNTVGLSVGVVKGGKTYTYNYGEVEIGTRRLPTADTYYELGSTAKTFIATMLAQAVVQGKVKLEDDIRLYLPGQYPNLAYDGHPIRLVHLANHTSGLPESPRTFPWDSLSKLSLTAQYRYFEHYTKDKLLADLHTLKLKTEPGTVYSYNGNAFHVLIAILEQVYHMPYEQLLTQFCKAQLGMRDTKNNLSAIEERRFAQGYNQRREAVPRLRNPRTMTGGPGLNSTMSDMLRYARANLAEKPAALKLTHHVSWGQNVGYALGLGWMLDNNCQGERYIYHSGRSPGYQSVCVLYPREDIGIVLLVNETVNQGRLLNLEQLLAQRIISHR